MRDVARRLQDPEREAAEREEEEAVARTFRLAAQYIALSFALQSGREVGTPL